MTTQAPEETSLLTFPTDFPIKIMGLNIPSFPDVVTALIQEELPSFDPSTFEIRHSSAQKYLSLTCTLNVDSQMQLDAIYRVLSGHPDVLMVL